MTILVMLNGPPRAGKDTATAAIVEAVGMPVRVLKATEPIKDETHRRLGLDCAHDAYEALKDAPLPEFGGQTPRQAYIATSRDLKARFGEDIVCRMLVARLRAAGEPVVVVPDLGDGMEADWLLAEAGDENALLLRIHREGHDFSRDCRTWVHLPETVRQADLENRDGFRDEFERSVGEIAATFVADAGGPRPSGRVA